MVVSWRGRCIVGADAMFKRFSLTAGAWGLQVPRACQVRPGVYRLPILGKALDLVLDQNAVRDLHAQDSCILTIQEHSAYQVRLPDTDDDAQLLGADVLKLVGPAPVDNSNGGERPPDTFLQVIRDLKIEGKYAPMRHQLVAAWFKASHRRGFDLSTMRTGKTGSTILALAYLLRTQQIGRVLVLAPLSCVRPVWLDALRATLPSFTASAVIGSRAAKLKAMSMPSEVKVTNYETVKLLYAQWKTWRPDCVVVDECTHYASGTTQRTKAIRQLIRECDVSFVWGLTGTPGHDPLKAFAMSKTINPGAVAVKSLTAWRDLTMFKFGAQDWQWRPKASAPAAIKNALSPAILFRKDDLFDLPPVTYAAREAALTREQEVMLTQLRSSMLALSESGQSVTAQQKAALASKLLQVAVGVVYDDHGDYVTLPNAPRLEVIDELVHESERKTVIFGAFTGGLRRLVSDLEARGHVVGLVDGSTTERKRTEIFRSFQHDTKGAGGIDVLVAHPRTTAFGVELAAADLMIFDGAPLSGDFVFGQAVERMSSLKQTAGKITIFNVSCTTEERLVYRALQQGRSESEAVAALFARRVS